jgi:hypothetical protein
MDKFLTRKELAEFLSHEVGVPTSLAKLNKLACNNLGPPVDAYWGNRPLYRRATGKLWAEQELKPTPRPSRRWPKSDPRSDSAG